MKPGDGRVAPRSDAVIVGMSELHARGITEEDLDALLTDNALYKGEPSHRMAYKARLEEISWRLLNAVPLLRVMEGLEREVMEGLPLTVRMSPFAVTRAMANTLTIVPDAGPPRSAWLLTAARLMGEMHNVRVWTSDLVAYDGAFFICEGEDPMTRLARVGAGLRVRAADVELVEHRKLTTNNQIQWDLLPW